MVENLLKNWGAAEPSSCQKRQGNSASNINSLLVMPITFKSQVEMAGMAHAL
jgi:hypothetical protein